MPTQHAHTLHEAARAAPALVGTGYTFLGLPLGEWAALVTILYVAYQGYSLYRRNKREHELHQKLMNRDKEQTP